MTDFDQFWACYPRRTAKFNAIKAYAKARTLASADEILKGVEAYKRNKPEYADYAHPASWLNAGRWMDEYDEPAAPSAAFDWYRECALLHQGKCGGSLRHTHQMLLDQRKADAS